VPTKEFQPLLCPHGSEDSNHLLDAERHTLPFPPESPEAPSLDAELAADVFYLTRRRPKVSGDMLGVDARRLPVIHNAFWVPGKVPSLNDLLDAKSIKQPILRSIIMRQKPSKGNRGGNRHNAYNEIKQDWKQRTVRAVGEPFVRIEKAFFGYLVVEESLKRDPSNICASAIKFIEDGLVEAGVIPNDGWNNVLGIRVSWVYRKGRPPGVYVVMSDVMLPEERLVEEYEDNFLVTLDA
jgi:hypothetical protein